MINKLTILFFVLMFSFGGYSSQKYTLMEVNLLSEESDYITVRSVGMGKNKKAAIAKAEENAIAAILFRGIPGSRQNNPMMQVNESEAKNKHKEYFDEFFKRNRYKTFIMSSVAVGEFNKNGRTERSIPVDIKINIKALRRDLESQGLILKFGY